MRRRASRADLGVGINRKKPNVAVERPFRCWNDGGGDL